VAVLTKLGDELRSDEAGASNDYDFHDCLLVFRPLHFEFAGRTRYDRAPHRFVTANRTTATNFTPEVFVSLGQSFVSTYHPSAETAVWIVQAGWAADLPERLRETQAFRGLPFRSFGNNIKIFKLTASGTLAMTTAVR